MFFKNEKGIAMGMAIIIGLVITVSGIALWQASTSDTLQVERDENSTQAFFYAKSGVELAVGLLQDDPYYLAHGEEAFFYGKLDEPTYSSTETDDYNIYFEIERDNNDYFIRSTGIVRVGGAQGAQAAANSLGFVINIEQLEQSTGMGGGGGQMPPLDMIFSISSGTNAMELDGNSRIEGLTGTNSIAANGVNLTENSVIAGDLKIGPGGDSETVVNNTIKVSGSITNLESFRSYSLPQFPEFPELTFKGFISRSGYINENGSYSSISISGNNSLTINVGSEDRLIRTGSLSISGNGRIVVNRNGNGKLIFYVDNTFSLGGNHGINEGGDSNAVIMYYAGSQSLNFSGNTRFVGSIYASNANFTITGNGEITGHIITGGNRVNVTGNADANVRVLYAPNAVLDVGGNGRIRGLSISQSTKMTGNARIINDSTIDLTFFQLLDWGSGEAGEPADWRAIGQWQRL